MDEGDRDIFTESEGTGLYWLSAGLILTYVFTSSYLAGYEDCETGFKNHDWVKGNPQAYELRDSSNGLKRLVGLRNFNLEATRGQIMQLREDIKGYDYCVNSKAVPSPNLNLDEVK